LPVRGILKLDKPYEVKSMDFSWGLNSSDLWYPATLTGARGDGKYEADVLMPPDQYGNQKKMHYPLVQADHIRDPSTKKVVEIPNTTLRLAVKKNAPMLPELTINGHSFTNYFCVPSPAANNTPAEINVTVSKDRSHVTADVGHGKLRQALDATKPGYKVHAKAFRQSKLKCEWCIQIGPFGDHRIVAETKSKNSKEVNVSIDGHHIVGGSAADLGGGEWCADIAVQGKLAFKYNLHRTDASGVATDQTTIVTKSLLHSHTLRLTIPDHSNLETAKLECDEMDFCELDRCKVLPEESMIDDSLETFEITHGVSVPCVMDKHSSTAGSASVFAKLVPDWGFASDFAKLIPSRDIASDFAKLVPGSIGPLGIFNGRQQNSIQVSSDGAAAAQVA